jgi:signal peptidase II
LPEHHGRQRDGGNILEQAQTRQADPVTGSPPGEATEARLPARRAGGIDRPANWPLFVGLALVIFIADQLTKSWIVANLQVGRPLRIVDDYLRLSLTHNDGALFGLFRDQAPVFAVFSVVVIGLIVWYQGRVGRSLLATTALGLLLGGAFGNLADRLQYGYVVDFVDAGIGTFRWYTFNVADASISCAILLLILLALRPEIVESGDRAADG